MRSQWGSQAVVYGYHRAVSVGVALLTKAAVSGRAAMRLPGTVTARIVVLTIGSAFLGALRGGQ